MNNALKRFVDEHDGDLPTDLSQLNANFPQPMSDALLKSYKLLHTGKLADLPKNEWIVGEIAPRLMSMTGPPSSSELTTGQESGGKIVPLPRKAILSTVG